MYICKKKYMIKESCVEEYKRGDSIFSLSKRYCTSPKKIKAYLLERGINVDTYYKCDSKRRKPSGYWFIKENVENAAKTCCNRREFYDKYSIAAKYANENGWMDEFSEKYFNTNIRYASMESYIHCVYSYEIVETKSVYVGITNNIKHRHQTHISTKDNDTIKDYCKKMGLEIPSPKILINNINGWESQIEENKWCEYYSRNCWTLLNKQKTGINSSSMGAVSPKWTYEACKLESLGCTSREEFKKKNGSAYNASRKNGWLIEFFPYKVKNDDGVFENLETCKKYAEEYVNLREIREKYPFLYHKILKNKWSSEIKEHLQNVHKDNDNDKLLTFIKRAKDAHKGENIDYSKVVYINNRTPVCLIDKDLRPDGTEYGEYWQTPSNHLKGQSHPDKRREKISKNKSSKQNEIIERFKIAHPNETLDYSEVVYVNMHTKVKIIDRDLMPNGEEYGEFWQEPVVHLKGCGHPLKGKHKQIVKQSSNTEDFIEKCKKIHFDKDYDYSKVEYINNKTKVAIVCHKHGEFKISPDNFLQGKGCPKCGNHLSYAEDEIYNLISKYYETERNNRTVLNGQEVDIYVPCLKMGIEYHGLRWHGENFGKNRKYHLNKLNVANENGIKLIQIFEDEYVNSKDIVINKIKHILHIADGDLRKIPARKCKIKKINREDAKVFLTRYHIQGYVPSTIHYGAFLSDELVAVMSFTFSENKWTLGRFASNYNCVCQGIGGKLFKHFIREHNPTYIKSFADRRWTTDVNDNLYTKLGFQMSVLLEPEYRYVNYKLFGCNRMHKFSFRKQLLHKKYGFPLTMTESEMTKEMGCDRIWDCGLIKYVWTKQ